MYAKHTRHVRLPDGVPAVCIIAEGVLYRASQNQRTQLRSACGRSPRLEHPDLEHVWSAHLVAALVFCRVHSLVHVVPLADSVREAGGADLLEPELKGSIGEGPNHSNYSDRSSVRILGIEFFQNSGFFVRKFKEVGKFQHFQKYRRNSDKNSSKSQQKSMERIQR